MNHNGPSRREWLKSTVALGVVAGAARGVVPSAQAETTDETQVIDIGTRRELFIDTFLIDRMEGKAVQRLHHPVPREVALVHDEPWEGTGSGYHSVFQDGDKYRMYYKAWHLDVTDAGVNTNRHPLFCCYAESDDGIHWRKPDLGLHA
ncbi:MAG: hypothetical protein VB878_19455, partial [Pirellulaceae bacterium]